MSELKIKKLHSNAKLPERAYPGDAGLDLFSIEDLVIKKGERATISTGIAIELPENCTGLIWDRSGLAFKHGVTGLGGVVDHSYRGEVKVCLINLGPEDYEVKAGEKVAQIIVQHFVELNPVFVEELSDGHRADRGFGSSGK